MQNADSPMEPEMALFQKALPMLMSKRGKRGRNESVVDFANASCAGHTATDPRPAMNPF